MWMFILFGKLDKQQQIRTTHRRHRQPMASCKCNNTSAEQSHSQNCYLLFCNWCMGAFFGSICWLACNFSLWYFRLLSLLFSRTVQWNQGAKAQNRTTEFTMEVFRYCFAQCIYICGSRQILRLIFQHRCKFCISNIAEQWFEKTYAHDGEKALTFTFRWRRSVWNLQVLR